MRNLVFLLVVLCIGFGEIPNAFAQATPADEDAVVKDQAAIARAQTDIERDRAQKAQDKADGNWAGQAIDSLALGYDHVFHSEKSGEKSADTIIINHSNNQ